MKLENKVAIVTGSASGMGLEEAELFAREGARVVIADVNKEAGEKVAADIKSAGGEATFIEVNMREAASVQALVDATIAAYGKLDIVVNNAGIFDKYATILETDESQWDLILDVNLKGIYLMAKAALPPMIEQGGGTFVNIASVAGLVAAKGGAAYTASKHGVIGLTKHMVSAYAKDGIRTNAIAPGTIVTPLIKDVVANIPTDPVPMRRFGQPSEVAELAVFLASEEAQFMNGAIIPIDGGFTLQ